MMLLKFAFPQYSYTGDTMVKNLGHTHAYSCIHTLMHTSKPWRILIRSVDYVNVSILVVILVLQTSTIGEIIGKDK